MLTLWALREGCNWNGYTGVFGYFLDGWLSLEFVMSLWDGQMASRVRLESSLPLAVGCTSLKTDMVSAQTRQGTLPMETTSGTFDCHISGLFISLFDGYLRLGRFELVFSPSIALTLWTGYPFPRGPRC